MSEQNNVSQNKARTRSEQISCISLVNNMENIYLLKTKVNTSQALLSRNCMKFYYHYRGNLWVLSWQLAPMIACIDLVINKQKYILLKTKVNASTALLSRNCMKS